MATPSGLVENAQLSVGNNFSTNVIVQFSGLDDYIGQSIIVQLNARTNYSKQSIVNVTQSVGYTTFSVSADEVEFYPRQDYIELQGQILLPDETSIQLRSGTLSLFYFPDITDISVTSSWADETTFISGVTTYYLSAKAETYFGATIYEADVEFEILPSNDPDHMSFGPSLDSEGVYRFAFAPNVQEEGQIGELNFEVRVKDSRGKRSTESIKFTVKEHAAPTITNDIYRCDNDGNRTMGGEYIAVTGWATANPSELAISAFSVKLYAVDGNNTKTLIDSSNLTDGTQVILGQGLVTADGVYSVEFEATDNASTYGGTSLAATLTQTVPVVYRIINIKDGGTGVAFGKTATDDNLLDSAWGGRFDGNLTLFCSDGAVRGLRVVYNDQDVSDMSISIGRGAYTQDGVTRYYPNRWNFFVYSRDSNTRQRLAYCERYGLPIVDLDMTQNKDYNIWTTKTIPEPPSTNGTYVLKATRTSSGVTYTWVAG